jgi:predicted dienelactone hydrolase
MLNRAWRNLALIALLLPPAFPRLARAQTKSAALFKVGTANRSFTPKEPYNWRGAKTHALLTTVWYPAESAAVEKPVLIPGMSQVFVTGSAARDASLAASPAKFPLIVLSHGTGGSAMQMAWLGSQLAAHGYIAAAVNHQEIWEAHGTARLGPRRRLDALLQKAKNSGVMLRYLKKPFWVRAASFF